MARRKKTNTKSIKKGKRSTNGNRSGDSIPLLNLWSPAIQAQIKELIHVINPSGDHIPNIDIIHEMMVTALKSAQSRIGRGDLKILSRSIRELRYAFKIFKDYRDVQKITIFGSARTKPSDISYKLAKKLCRDLTRKGFMIITGAGPGIMRAGNQGALPGKSFGVNIRLPFEQYPNKYIAYQPTYIDCRFFFTRKLVFIKEANAAVIFPGGFGTLDEAFEILTLVQTGKSDPIPVILFDTPKNQYWKHIEHYIRRSLIKYGMISPEDSNLYDVVTTTQEAVKIITKFYSNYHSIRYVGKNLVMRFHNHIEDRQLSYLNKHFKNILVRGSFKRGGPLPDEENQPELVHLPRLVFQFNRVNNGRLRQLIDYMNKE